MFTFVVKPIGKSIRVIGVYGEPTVAFILNLRLSEPVHFHHQNEPIVSLGTDGSTNDLVEFDGKRAAPAAKADTLHNRCAASGS